MRLQMCGRAFTNCTTIGKQKASKCLASHMNSHKNLSPLGMTWENSFFNFWIPSWQLGNVWPHQDESPTRSKFGQVRWSPHPYPSGLTTNIINMDWFCRIEAGHHAASWGLAIPHSTTFLIHLSNFKIEPWVPVDFSRQNPSATTTRIPQACQSPSSKPRHHTVSYQGNIFFPFCFIPELSHARGSNVIAIRINSAVVYEATHTWHQLIRVHGASKPRIVGMPHRTCIYRF